MPNDTDTLRTVPPLHFVANGGYVWPEIEEDRLDTLTEPVLAERCISSYDNWILQSYVRFHQAGLRPTLSDHPVSGKVNFIDGWHLRLSNRPSGIFVLVTRADSRRPFMGNYWIEQNGLRGTGTCHDWIPHWPQPDIQPRDPSRGSAILNLGYKGLAKNLDAAFAETRLGPLLREAGVDLQHDLEDRASGMLRWNDYRSLDLCLAVRNLTKTDARGKPASKLINAWAAGVPALVGPEPAFLELKETELDFIEVRRPEDVVAAVAKLRDQPSLYTAMVENGLRRARDFTVDRVLQRWIETLSGPVRLKFERWERTPGIVKALRWGIGAPLEKASRHYHRYQAHNGERLF